MREVKKVSTSLLCVSFVLILLSCFFSFTAVFAEPSLDPSEIFNPSYQIIENQYLKVDSPTSKASFLNSALKSTNLKATIESNTAKLKTGDAILIYDSEENLLGKYTVFIKGDLNCDGDIDINDVAKVYQFYRGRISMSRAAQLAGDVTGTGDIGLGDVAKIYQYSKGKLGSLN